MVEFKDRLKALRVSHNLTQDEFSKQSKIGRSVIGMYETGRRKPSLEALETIADYFNVTIDYLTGKTDIPYPSPPINKAISLDDPEIQAANDISKAPPDAKFLKPDEEEAVEEALGSLISAAKAISKIVETKITSYDDENRVNYVMSWDREECQMIAEYRDLSEQDKNVVRSMIHSLSSKNASPALKED